MEALHALWARPGERLKHEMVNESLAVAATAAEANNRISGLDVGVTANSGFEYPASTDSGHSLPRQAAYSPTVGNLI